MAITVDINQAKECLTTAIRAQVVPMLTGSPAVGKSSIVHQIAKEYGLLVIDLRLSQCDPTDLLGFPHIIKDTCPESGVDRSKATYVPMTTFPVEGDPVPTGYNGWLLFLDEFNSADRSVQKAAYKLVLDKMVGERKLHSKVAIICAGNLDTDNAIVEEMSTALQSRLVHLELSMCSKIWLNWAMANGIDHRITSYIQFKPGSLYSFNPRHTDKTYASPRTWAFASSLLQQMEFNNPCMLPLLAGAVSEGVAREFLGFLKIFTQLPTLQQIVTNPETLAVPSEPSILYALSGSIGHNAAEDNIGALMKFVKRMPIEFQVVCLREVVRRNKPLLQHLSVSEWVSRNATELF